MLMELKYFYVLLIFCTHAWYGFGQHAEKMPNEMKLILPLSLLPFLTLLLLDIAAVIDHYWSYFVAVL
jgi:hypothetical protein